jgi:hypothetical protein
MSRCGRTVAAVAVALSVVGCGGSSSDSSSTAAPTVDDSTPAAAEPPVTDPPAPTSVPEPAASEATTATAPTTTPPPPPAPPDELADLDAITEISVTTPVSGNGERPLFAWQPVEAATSYSLVLTTSDGQAYWAWTGPESQIWLGGSADEPPADATGPYMVEPMTLRVFAADADGVIVAASRPVDIAP